LDIVSAAAIGRTEVVTELLSNDPTSIHAADAGGNTALHLAAWRRETEMVKLLLANGANPNLQNKRGEPPVSFALVRLCDCEVSYPRAIDIGHLLVKHGAKCDIWTAAKLESVEGLDACLRDDPTLLNAPNDEGLTPLQLASWLASWTSAQPVMEFLLKKGAALDICTAVQLGEKKQIMALLDADPTLVNTRTVEESTPLHLAARNGDEALVRCLVERGAAIDAKDSWWGCTPLLLAGHRKYQPIVEFLLEQGADINARDKEGCSLLHWAMTWADTEFVKSLISRGADLNAKNVQHATPMYKPATALHAAAFEGNVELVEFFLEQGLDIHDGELNWTLLHIAAMLGHMAVAQFLLERGANINIQSERDGFTPLHKALHRGQKAVAELLISRGADVNIRDNWGWTPLRLAIKGCHKDVADLLHQHGATA
jgi:ankyrin repeat protein